MIEVKIVSTKKQMDVFAKFGNKLYEDCPYYVPDLEMDIKDTLNERKNPAYEFCESQLFLAYDGDKVVGRVAALINHRANETWNVKNVRFGWIDFIDDKRVSAALIEAVENWGKEKGMTSCQGPMGFTDFDKEGMLTEGFDKLGSITTIYNYPYYADHIEALGYETEAEWVQIRVRVPEGVPEKFLRGTQMAMKRYNLNIKKLNKKMMNEGGYGQKVFDLLNEAYSPLFGFSKLSDKQIKAYIDTYLNLLDLKFLTCIVDGEDNMIGVGITMNSMSNAFRKSKGRLFPFGWYHLLRSLKFKMEDTVEMLLIAVKPEYQGKGVNTLLFFDLIPTFNKAGFIWAETAPQLVTNSKELNQWNSLNPTFPKRRKCFHKVLVK